MTHADSDIVNRCRLWHRISRAVPAAKRTVHLLYSWQQSIQRIHMLLCETYSWALTER